MSDAPSAIPPLVGGEATGSFEWRAPTLSGRARRRRTGRVIAAGVVAGLVVAAVAAVVAAVAIRFG